MSQRRIISADTSRMLISAAKQGDVSVLRQHVSELPFVKDEEWEMSVLAWSANNGQLECVKFVSHEHPQMMRMGDKNGATPLYNACFYGHLAVASLLMERDPESTRIAQK